jgi:flagellar biosynthesis anti-sigma factor FlgM
MKIHNPNDVSAVSTPSAKSTAGVDGEKRRDTSRGVDNSGADRAELSGLAGKISAASGRDTANRAANVEQLRTQVSEGRYQPDPAAISRGIVNDAVSGGGAATSRR